MEKYNKNDDNWVVDYRFYPEQGYCITNKKENEYRQTFGNVARSNRLFLPSN